MVVTKKTCPECGPVETRYSNCPRCWGPVSRRDDTKQSESPMHTLQRLPSPDKVDWASRNVKALTLSSSDEEEKPIKVKHQQFVRQTPATSTSGSGSNTGVEWVFAGKIDVLVKEMHAAGLSDEEWERLCGMFNRLTAK